MVTGSNPVRFLNEIQNISIYTGPRHYAFLITSNFLSRPQNFISIASGILKKSGLSNLDRRFVYQVSKGTIRFIYTIDFAIELFSGIKINRIESSSLNILRIAFYQIIFLDKVPSYAAVNESVNLAKEISGYKPSKFVNAVLRKATKVSDISSFIKDKIKYSKLSQENQLSIMYSFPTWILKEWGKYYSGGTIEKLCDYLNREPHIFARVNTIKISKKELEKIFHNNGIKTLNLYFPEPSMDLCNANTSETGLSFNYLPEDFFSDTLLLDSSQDIEKMPGFDEGFFSIQDFSSQIAIKYVFEPCKGERILDICGAPGGKALYCSEITRCDSEICSVDISHERLQIFKKNIKRLGLKNINLVEADASEDDFLYYNQKPSQYYYCYFDKIFIDAPCSALGTIAKNPDIKYIRQYKDIEKLVATSSKILTNCLRYLKKGGILVFYTCTLSVKENQDVINKFLEINKNICAPEPMENIRRIFSKQHKKEFGLLFNKNASMLEIMPFYFNGEGGFICKIKKTG
jgi:16S rRNA (cytosine967-C5)-methyltransferase